MTWQFDGSWIQARLSDLSYLTAAERLGRVLIPRIVWRGPADVNAIALTFDDGPHPEFTPKILDVLARHAVPATFFQIGRHIEAFPSITQAVASAGHEVANHTHSHDLMMRWSNARIAEEIQRTHGLIADRTGQNAKFLRPPMGLFSKRTLNVTETAGYQTVVGDVYPRDPHRPGTEKLIRRMMRRCRTGSIVILHDGGNTAHVDRSQTVSALSEVIPRLKDKFEFVTLSKLLSNIS